MLLGSPETSLQLDMAPGDIPRDKIDVTGGLEVSRNGDRLGVGWRESTRGDNEIGAGGTWE